MSDHDQTIAPSDESVAWDDIESSARQMFHVWMGSGEIEWVRECWQHFANEGLTGCLSALDTTATHLRLLALARIYEQFCGYAWEENPETPLSYLAEKLSIDPLSLGILAGAAAPTSFDDDLDEFDLREAALMAATDAMRKEIHTCLSKAYGGDMALYCRMATTNLNPDAEADEFRTTNFNYPALQFVTDGFPA